MPHGQQGRREQERRRDADEPGHKRPNFAMRGMGIGRQGGIGENIVHQTDEERTEEPEQPTREVQSTKRDETSVGQKQKTTDEHDENGFNQTSLEKRLLVRKTRKFYSSCPDPLPV